MALVAALGASGCDSAGDDGGDERTEPPPKVDLGKAAKGVPNFVIVMTDDQDAESLESMSHVRRDLIDEGVKFTNFLVTVPECCPSRASFLTGQYAHNHGVESNEPPNGGFSAFDDSRTLPVALREAGYRTGYVGKYLNGYGWDALGNDPAYVPPGWSTWEVLTNHTEYQMYDYQMNRDGQIVSFGSDPADYQTSVIQERGEAFIRDAARSERPFLLWAAPVAPHLEGVLPDHDPGVLNPRPAPRDMEAVDDVSFPRPPSFNERDVSDKSGASIKKPLTKRDVQVLETQYRSRIASLRSVDRLVHSYVETLRRAGELDETVFVFTSDNGYLLGEHRRVGKTLPFDASANVPFVVRGPGFGKGAETDEIAGNIDLPTTIAELGEASLRKSDGRSLVPLAKPSGDAGRAILLEVLDGVEFKAVRTKRFLYTQYARGGEELYDLERDPFELESVVDDSRYAGDLRTLKMELAALAECAGASCN